MNAAAKPAPEVACPTCAGRAVFGPQNPFRPFCSERCKLIDLGAWAEDRYKIAGANAPPEFASGEGNNSESRDA